MDTILFPLFEVPLMTEEIESALTGNLEDGQLFRDIWKGLFDSPDTVPLNIGKRNWNTGRRSALSPTRLQSIWGVPLACLGSS